MLKVTADTNILISGLNFSGNPRCILSLAEAGAIRLVVSDSILDEIDKVLRRKKFGWPESEIRRALYHNFTVRGSCRASATCGRHQGRSDR